MKKLLGIILFSVVIPLAHSASRLIYCPQRIICSEENNIQSCKPDGNYLYYWEEKAREVAGKISKGEYSFFYVDSELNYSDSHKDSFTSSCFYQNATAGYLTTIRLINDPQKLPIFAYTNEPSKWDIGKMSKYPVICISRNDPQGCPLTEDPKVMPLQPPHKEDE